ncbi:MAG: hypothetical protein A2W10_02155 [Deltaproteobacteria bacterium RBG_16_55_12]|nr:MAG: hypothetical protein A2W10_02155 [Deltaproteobacteria bacterium RBG_16_55_12]
MNTLLSVTGVVLVIFALSSCALEQEKVVPPAKPAAPAVAEAKKAAPAEKKAEAKVKAEKASGDVGLMDLEKNYLILVTKEGKLITADFTGKTKVTKLVPQPAKMSDINLGQSAAVTYNAGKGGKNIATSVEYAVKAKKGE